MLKDHILKLETGSRPRGGALTVGIPSLGGEHLSKDGGFKLSKLKFVSIDYFNKLKKGIVEENDILIVKDGATTGKVSFVGSDFPLTRCAVNEHVYRLVVDDTINPKYFFYFLFSDLGQNQMLRDFRGATVGGITKNFLKYLDCEFPSFKEQKRITKILEDADRLQKNALKLVEEYNALPQSIFNEMFGNPILNKSRYETKQLIEVIDEERPITYGILKPGQDIKPDGVPYIKVVDVRNGEIIKESVCHTTIEISDKYKRSTLKAGDILFSIRGHVGRTCMVPPMFLGANITQDTARLACNETINPYFLNQLLQNIHFSRNYQKFIKGAAVKGINLGDLKKLPIIVPPKLLQEKFAEKILLVEQQKVILKKELKQSQDLFNCLLQKAFKGELVENKIVSE
ncbi:restriction endonuclease subunit S [Sanyastnella coralliicola]|uniref:restriction endonuclease subunit S n=1 Tax=Sanyastnella coralliicola TaxID=3069118 RepID=UPI0027B9BAA6|nr:restriction endonuclease subunit S [Longitalea sp. SCSIO 12813]